MTIRQALRQAIGIRIRAALAFLITLGIVIASEARQQAHAQSSGVFQGAQGFVILSAASNNSQTIGIPGPHSVMGLIGINTAAVAQFVKLVDTASAPDCTSSAKVIGYFPVNTNALNGGYTLDFGPSGIRVTDGLGVCITGAYGLTDNTAAATGLALTVLLK